MQIIPLDCSPNQTFQITLSVNGINITLKFFFSYNYIAGYWIMRVTDPQSGTVLLDSIPLVVVSDATSVNNLIGQYDYLSIGSAYLVKTGTSGGDYPDDANLGTDFVLVWDDNVDISVAQTVEQAVSFVNSLTALGIKTTIVQLVGKDGLIGKEGDQYKSESYSTVSIGLGSKSFVALETNLAYQVGSVVRAYNDPTHYMEGTCTFCSGAGLTINVTRIVGSGIFSSWYFSIAADISDVVAIQAACDADKVATDADAVATAADRVQTGLDRVATGQDKIATAADRVQTGLDRVATGQDKIATAADRVQTGLDRTATGQDKIATAADRVQTGLDRAQTGADRTQTGIDKAAADADVVAANAARDAAQNYALALSATSVTSNVIGLGSKTFATQSGKQFTAGQYLIISSQANPTNYMFGQITSYSGSPASLVVNVLAVGGSGTKTDWNINLSGIQGVIGVTGSIWYYGSGAPAGSPVFGLVNDLYLDVTNADLYQKLGSPAAWTLIGNISGRIPVGAATTSGSPETIVVTYSPAITLTDKMIVNFVADAANTTTTPYFNPNSQGAIIIKKQGNKAVSVGDIPGGGAGVFLQYYAGSPAHWELLNPAVSSGGGISVAESVGGTADAITAVYNPAITALTDKQMLAFIATGANTSTTPSFTPNSGMITPYTIKTRGNQALVAGDIFGAGMLCILCYIQSDNHYELTNPAAALYG